MIRLKQNDKPILPICQMRCDNDLHEKLNDYELTKFLNSHSTNLLIGKPRSGKTSLLYSLFKSKNILRKVFHNIFLFQPANSRQSMKDQLFDKLPDDKKFDELTYDNLSEVLARCQAAASENYNNAILFDDMGAYLKNKETLQIFKELIFNRRHIRTSVFFLTQTYYSVPKEIRRLFSNIFVFKCSKTEMTNIWDENVEMDEKYIVPVMKLVYDKLYQFMFINTDTQKLFKGFDEIIIQNDEDDLAVQNVENNI